MSETPMEWNKALDAAIVAIEIERSQYKADTVMAELIKVALENAMTNVRGLYRPE